MCFGNNCPIKKTCKRFENKSVQIYQWYSDFKGEIKNGKFVCDSYIELFVSNENKNPEKTKK